MVEIEFVLQRNSTMEVQRGNLCLLPGSSEVNNYKMIGFLMKTSFGKVEIDNSTTEET